MNEELKNLFEEILQISNDKDKKALWDCLNNEDKICNELKLPAELQRWYLTILAIYLGFDCITQKDFDCITQKDYTFSINNGAVTISKTADDDDERNGIMKTSKGTILDTFCPITCKGFLDCIGESNYNCIDENKYIGEYKVIDSRNDNRNDSLNDKCIDKPKDKRNDLLKLMVAFNAATSSKRFFNEIHCDEDPFLTMGFGHFAEDTLNRFFKEMPDKIRREMICYILYLLRTDFKGKEFEKAIAGDCIIAQKLQFLKESGELKNSNKWKDLTDWEVWKNLEQSNEWKKKEESNKDKLKTLENKLMFFFENNNFMVWGRHENYGQHIKGGHWFYDVMKKALLLRSVCQYQFYFWIKNFAPTTGETNGEAAINSFSKSSGRSEFYEKMREAISTEIDEASKKNGVGNAIKAIATANSNDKKALIELLSYNFAEGRIRTRVKVAWRMWFQNSWGNIQVQEKIKIYKTNENTSPDLTPKNDYIYFVYDKKHYFVKIPQYAHTEKEKEKDKEMEGNYITNKREDYLKYIKKFWDLPPNNTN